MIEFKHVNGKPVRLVEAMSIIDELVECLRKAHIVIPPELGERLLDIVFAPGGEMYHAAKGGTDV